jgi:two-component system, cell cycle response regulator
MMDEYSMKETINVLLVEDNQDHIDIINELLSNCHTHYNVTTRCTIEDALVAIANLEDFDVILLDYVIGDCVSDEVLRFSDQIPIVILTAYSSEDLDIHLMDKGASDFMCKKDLSQSIITRSIRHSIERHHLIMQLKKMSLYDQMTGLYNRRYVVEKIEELIGLAQRNKAAFSICLIDLDNLKHINDNFGHNTGDNAINAVADALQESTRQTDTCARYAGDEFITVFPNSDLEDVKLYIERVKSSLAKKQVEGLDYQISASFGIAYYSRSDTVAEIIEKADQSLYKNKAVKPKLNTSTKPNKT